jgi:elongator complex protein 1
MTKYTQRTNGTINTQTSRRSSKNRRREERKRARGRKGSVYEEEYLVNSLRRLVERINAVNEDVGRLVDGLMRRTMREQARTVQNAMTEVVGLCNGLLAEVFGPKDVESGEQKSDQRNADLLNGDFEATRLGTELEKAAMPIVTKFELLTMLD